MKFEGKNYFETHEPNKRLIEPYDFELLQEMLREAEIAYRKEQIKFELYLHKQQNQGVKEAPDLEILETYKDKEILQKAKKKYRRNSIFMEMYLHKYPYAIIHGDYSEWERIYEQRYNNPERTGSDENFK